MLNGSGTPTWVRLINGGKPELSKFESWQEESSAGSGIEAQLKMSNDDYVVEPRRDSEIRENAKRLRKFLGLADVDLIDVLILENTIEIWTEKGVKPFRLEIVPDADLPNDSGLTTYDGSKIVVKIPRRIRHDAFMGHGYARYTFGHELGHATQHLDKLMLGASMPRRRLGNVTPHWIPKFRSAEHHAMVFAAAFLINEDTARGMSSPDEIALQFGLSLHAARIYFEQMMEEIERPASSLRVRKMADEFKATVTEKSAPKTTITFLNDLCSTCGQQKLFPVGHKFMCQACDTVRDGFQDGDQVQ
jgi:hypothetical protein